MSIQEEITRQQYWQGNQQEKLLFSWLERRGNGAALYVRKQLEYLELCLGVDQKPNNSLWIKSGSQTNVVWCCIVGIYYRHTDQEENADKNFFKQLGEVSCAQVVFLTGDHCCIYQKDDTGGLRKSRRLLERTDENFLVTEKLTRKQDLLDHVVKRRKNLSEIRKSEAALVAMTMKW